MRCAGLPACHSHSVSPIHSKAFKQPCAYLPCTSNVPTCILQNDVGTDTPLQVSEDEGGDEDDAYDGDASDGYGSDSGEGTSDEDSGYSSDGAPARRNGAASDGNSSDPPGLVDASVRAPFLAAALGAASCVCVDCSSECIKAEAA